MVTSRERTVDPDARVAGVWMSGCDDDQHPDRRLGNPTAIAVIQTYDGDQKATRFVDPAGGTGAGRAHDVATPVGSVAAQPGGDRAGFDEQVRPLLAEHCVGCHNADLQTADLSFETFLTGADATAHPDLWEKVSEKLRAGLMPPIGRSTPRC